MVWKSFRALDEAFGIEVGEGIWDYEWVPKPRQGGFFSGEQRSAMQRGKKRGKYKTKGGTAHNARSVLGYPSVTAAAEGLGVSRRTIQRWINNS